MATFRKAEFDCASLVEEIVASTYPELKEHGVDIELLFAHAERNETTGEPNGPALKHQGWPACAVVKVNSQRDRAAGLADVRITFDGDNWKEWTDQRKRAVIDHELCHLEFKLDDEGAVQLDDCNRPKLKLRPHDFQLGGFCAVVNRHGDQAVEAMGLRVALKQLEFDWDAPEVHAAKGQPLFGAEVPERAKGEEKPVAEEPKTKRRGRKAA